MDLGKPATRAASCGPRRNRGRRSIHNRSLSPGRGDIRPLPMRMLIAPTAGIEHGARVGGARPPSDAPDAAPAGAEDEWGALLIPRLRHGLQHAAAAAAFDGAAAWVNPYGPLAWVVLGRTFGAHLLPRPGTFPKWKLPHSRAPAAPALAALLDRHGAGRENAGSPHGVGTRN